MVLPFGSTYPSSELRRGVDSRKNRPPEESAYQHVFFVFFWTMQWSSEERTRILPERHFEVFLLGFQPPLIGFTESTKDFLHYKHQVNHFCNGLGSGFTGGMLSDHCRAKAKQRAERRGALNTFAKLALASPKAHGPQGRPTLLAAGRGAAAGHAAVRGGLRGWRHRPVSVERSRDARSSQGLGASKFFQIQTGVDPGVLLSPIPGMFWAPSPSNKHPFGTAGR